MSPAQSQPAAPQLASAPAAAVQIAPLPFPTIALPPQPAPTVQPPVLSAAAEVPTILPIQNASPELEPIIIGLTSLAEGWLETVRKEIVLLKLIDSKVALPFEAIDQGLRQGRLHF